MKHAGGHSEPYVQTGGYRIVKRCLDVVISGALLIALAIPLLGIAIAVRATSKGPAFYATPRQGLGGRWFRMLKFRTMRRLNDEEEERFRTAVAASGILPKASQDPRITQLGRVLRRTSIDELPQLINVLRGDMSLVGPRPVMPEMLANHPDFAEARSRVAPGMTGLWQVTARHRNTSIDSMIEPDLHYVGHVTFLGDASILLRTVKAVLSSRGAV